MLDAREVSIQGQVGLKELGESLRCGLWDKDTQIYIQMQLLYNQAVKKLVEGLVRGSTPVTD